jgi:hypothetical protein
MASSQQGHQMSQQKYNPLKEYSSIVIDKKQMSFSRLCPFLIIKDKHRTHRSRSHRYLCSEEHLLKDYRFVFGRFDFRSAAGRRAQSQ